MRNRTAPAAALLCLLLAAAPALAATVTLVELTDFRRVRPQPTEAEKMGFMIGDRPGLKLVLEIKGEDVEKAGAYGMLKIESASDDAGGELKFDEHGIGMNEFHEEFVKIDRGMMYMGEENPPKDAIRIELPFESPPRAAKAISIRATLQLKKIETMEVVVPAALGEVKHEELEKRGLTFAVTKPDMEGFAYQAGGKLAALHDVRMVDADGKEIESQGSSSYGDGETVSREVWLASAPPADAKLKLLLVIKEEDAPVAIELKDLALP